MQHAGGVIFTDGDFNDATALMKAPNGDTITQFDLGDAEKTGLIKIDLLAIEALDKIRATLDLLIEHGHIEEKETLRETYESAIGIYNLERDAKEMWEMAWRHEVPFLFQMDQLSGIQGIELTKPESVDDLAVLNSIIRLMAGEKGGELPLDKYARFKKNPQLWYDEMSRAGLTKEEQELLKPHLETSYGICEAQEKFMKIVQLPEVGGHSLLWADRLRKAVAKKNAKDYEQLEKEFFDTVEEKKLSKSLARYVWYTLVATSRGYGFNALSWRAQG